MKKFLQLALICAGMGIIATSTSCSSTYDATPTVPGKDTMKNPLRGDFTAIVDGVNFTANAKYCSDVTVDGTRTITVSGVQDSYNKDPQTNSSISLSITNYAGPNVYPIQFGVAGTYVVKNKGVDKVFLAKTGDTLALINITSDGDKLEGTFNFVVAPGGLGGADNHFIGDGKFSIPK